ncbi:unnamed protein product [Moneuplotes crassus]|uniref:Mitochondrial carrier protein n=1 Tax=Euplotes crassus TaxID=5936 RepID=A0AAD1XJD2_EUPCR|nr:unnamed protein product [Moneuplotes crassus]
MKETQANLNKLGTPYQPNLSLFSKNPQSAAIVKQREGPREPSSKARLLASSLSTMVGVTLTSPIEVLKTRMQVQNDKQFKVEMYQKIRESFLKIWRQEGFAGMFKGYRATLICTPIFNSIYFPIYEKLRLTFAESYGQDKSSFSVVASSCSIAGLISSILTNPMWVVRTRMITEEFKAQGIPDYEIKYKGLYRSIRRVWMNEGFLTLYSGLMASFLNLSHVLVYFTIYERTKIVLKNNIEPDSSSLSSYLVSLSVIISKITASMVSYPSELVRARQHDTRNHDQRGNHFFKVVKRSYMSHGILGFYTGFSLNLLKILPQNIIVFMFYEKLSHLLTNKYDL